MEFTPLYDNILVKRIDLDTKTESGLFLSMSHQEKPNQGTVVAVGEGYRLPNGKLGLLDVELGDTVIFEKYAGRDIEIEGQTYVIMKESAVMCIIE